MQLKTSLKTLTRLGLVLFIPLLLSLAILMLLSTLAASSSTTEDAALAYASLASLVLVAATGGFASATHNRGFLILALTLALWLASAMAQAFHAAALDVEQENELCKLDEPACARGNALFRATLAAIVGLAGATAAVVAWLMSEKIQEAVRSGTVDELHQRDIVLFGKVLDLPDQTVGSLSRLALINAVLVLLKIVGFIIVTVYAPSTEMAVFSSFLAVSAAMVLAAELYGLLARDRGWLMLAFLLHIWWLAGDIRYLTTVAVLAESESASCLDDDETCGRTAATKWSLALGTIGFFLHTIGAWFSMRTSEKIEDAAIGRTPAEQEKMKQQSLIHRLSVRMPFLAKLDIPNRTNAQLRSYAMGACVVEALAIVAFFIIAAVTTSAEARIYHFALGTWLIVTVVISFLSLVLKHRALTIVAVVCQTWTLAASTGYIYPSIVEKIKRENVCQAAETEQCRTDADVFAAQIAMSCLVFLLALAAAWLSYRLSERMAEGSVRATVAARMARARRKANNLELKSVAPAPADDATYTDVEPLPQLVERNSKME